MGKGSMDKEMELLFMMCKVTGLNLTQKDYFKTKENEIKYWNFYFYENYFELNYYFFKNKNLNNKNAFFKNKIIISLESSFFTSQWFILDGTTSF